MNIISAVLIGLSVIVTILYWLVYLRNEGFFDEESETDVWIKENE